MIESWKQESEFYNLGDGYSFKKANKDIFIKFNVIYSINKQWLHYDFPRAIDDLSNKGDEFLNSMYWIYFNDKCIGGVIISPNTLLNYFLIPPFENKYIVFDKINKALSAWSDNNEEIILYINNEDEKNMFTTFGYKVKRSKCAMIRPTNHYSIDFNSYIKVTSLTESITDETLDKLGNLFCIAHNNNPNKTNFTEDEISKKIKWLRYFLNQFSANGTLECSCFLTVDEHIIGACIVGKDEHSKYGYAGIVGVAVLPEYQGIGLAKKMINYTTSKAEKYCPAICLGVVIGNNAHSIYTKLGFISAPIIYTLYR